MKAETENVINEFIKFENVLINYDVSQNLEVEFSIDGPVKGSSKDWIGIYQFGWSNFESVLAYENGLGLPCDESGRRRKVRFSSKDIQHAKPGLLYQFVYVNKYLEIMGLSQYFQFNVSNQMKGRSVSSGVGEKVINEFVKFDNVLINYDVTQNLEVEFSIDGPVKGSSKDWTGIYQCGWRHFESVLAYENGLGLPCDATGRRRKVRFPSKDIQHAKPGFLYQFVYVNKYLEIMGVSQYFQFIVPNQMKGRSTSSGVGEDSFSLDPESSPITEIALFISETETNDNLNCGKSLKVRVIPRQDESSTNCKLFSISKWKDSCTSCYQCRSFFQMKGCHDELLEKIKQYRNINLTLQSRVQRLEKWLESEESNEKNDDLNACVFHFSGAVDKAIRSSVNEQESAGTCFDWDFSSKELYLKAIIGQQELTIRHLNKVVCEVGCIDLTKLSCPPPTALQDTVKTIRAEEKVVAEIFDVSSTSEDEL